MSGASHHPTPSLCDEVSWSESSRTTSTQNSIDSLIWSNDSLGCSPFKEDLSIPTTPRDISCSMTAATPALDEPIEDVVSKEHSFMSVSLDRVSPATLPIKAGKRIMTYKPEAMQILLDSESVLSSTLQGANFLKRVHSNSQLNGYRLDNVGWMFDTAQHLMQSEEATRKCCYYDVFQLAVALYDRYLSILFADDREEVYSFKIPAATCLCIASGVLNDRPFSPEELAETAMLSTTHIIREEFKVAKKLGWEYSKLSTPMEFIEYLVSVLEIDRTLSKRLLSRSALKSCYCMYRPDFLDFPYSVIGVSCILHTADTAPFNEYASHIRETCYHMLLHPHNTDSPTREATTKLMEKLDVAYSLLESSTNEIINSSH